MNYRTFKKFSFGAIAVMLLLGLLFAYGWVVNIIYLFHMSTVMNGEGAVRIAGIFVPPLGAIMGWFFS